MIANDTQCNSRWEAIADRALAGASLDRSEALEVLAAHDVEIPALLAAAFRVRRRHFGKQVQLYYLKNAKSGLCPEDCGYCSQSKLSTAPIEKYRLEDEKALLAGAEQAVQNRARTYCIVTSGRGPSPEDLQHVAGVVRKIKQQYPLHICACLGLLAPEDAQVLKQAGVDRVNHNLNTSRRFYEQICTTHTFDDRLATLRACKEAGLELCCGLIAGMGETDEDLVDVALTLRDLQVDSIPVNFLQAIDGTPLQTIDVLNPRYCLKVLCLLRLTNPQTELRIAGGRELHLRSLQAQALYAANSIFVSDYLTTSGQRPEDDFQMIEDLGFEIVQGAPACDDRKEPAEVV